MRLRSCLLLVTITSALLVYSYVAGAQRTTAPPTIAGSATINETTSYTQRLEVSALLSREPLLLLVSGTALLLGATTLRRKRSGAN